MEIYKVKSPKQNSSSKIFRDNWYPYYAGFSSSFVSSLIELHEFRPSKILDPWNGSGTTTSVSSAYGISSVGLDINPVMTIAAKSRALSSIDVIRAKAIALDTIANFKPMEVDSTSLLKRWFTDDTAALINGLISSFRESANISQTDLKTGNIDRSSSAIVLSIFKLARSSSETFKTSNPSWIRRSLDNPINIDFREFIFDLAKTVNIMVTESVYRTYQNNSEPLILTTSSESNPFRDGEFDFILGSPPYATRIDYAVKTSIELAILGFTEEDFKFIRKSMMGTTSINTSIDDSKLSDSILSVLDSIYKHPSKASSTYYYKTYLDYFIKLQNSIIESSRVLSNEGAFCLVVQNSYYKDIHIDLKSICRCIFKDEGFSEFQTIDFPSNISMNSVNRASLKYKTISKPVESVIYARR